MHSAFQPTNTSLRYYPHAELLPKLPGKTNDRASLYPFMYSLLDRQDEYPSSHTNMPPTTSQSPHQARDISHSPFGLPPLHCGITSTSACLFGITPKTKSRDIFGQLEQVQMAVSYITFRPNVEQYHQCAAFSIRCNGATGTTTTKLQQLN